MTCSSVDEGLSVAMNSRTGVLVFLSVLASVRGIEVNWSLMDLVVGRRVWADGNSSVRSGPRAGQREVAEVRL
jgi:hypothetical protein